LSNFAEEPQDPVGFDDVFSVARTGTLEEDGLEKYVTTMVLEYEKRVIGEYFHKEGYDKGKAEGLAEGKVEGIRLTAKNLRDLGQDVALIQQATGLSEVEIRAL
jgi:predicted transposase/invertase (TIGR01784 family)